MKTTMKTTVILWLMGLACAVTLTAWPATYYVATTGNDYADGSVGTPWLTVSNAATHMVAGDVAHVASGFYPERVTLTTSGTAGNPITFTGPYASAGAMRTVTNWGFKISGANYITVQYFACTNNTETLTEGSVGDWVDPSGISSYNSHHTTLMSNDVYGAGWVGIFIHEDTIGLGHDYLVQGNRCWSNTAAGMHLNLRTNSVCRWNEVWGTVAYTPKSPWWSYKDADGMQIFCTGGIIESNYVHDIWWHYDDPVVGGKNGSCHNDALQTWMDTGGRDSIRDSTIRGNIFDIPATAGNAWMAEGCSNNLIYKNVWRAHRIVNITTGGGNNPASQYFFNNTFICKFYQDAYDFIGDGDGIVCSHLDGGAFTNNLFICDSVGPAGQFIVNNYPVSTFTGGHNLFYYTGGSVTAQTGYTFDSTDVINSNPLLVAAFTTPLDFRFAAGSPAKDAGVALSMFATDILGMPRPPGAGWDIGAYESLSGLEYLPGVTPGAPVGISPNSPKPGESATPYYTFYTVPGATSYTICLWNYQTQSSTVWDLTPEDVDFGTPGQGRFLQPSNLDIGRYTWAASASNASGTSPWSGYKTFIVGLPPVAPVGTCPNAGGTSPTP